MNQLAWVLLLLSAPALAVVVNQDIPRDVKERVRALNNATYVFEAFENREKNFSPGTQELLRAYGFGVKTIKAEIKGSELIFKGTKEVRVQYKNGKVARYLVGGRPCALTSTWPDEHAAQFKKCFEAKGNRGVASLWAHFAPEAAADLDDAPTFGIWQEMYVSIVFSVNTLIQSAKIYGPQIKAWWTGQPLEKTQTPEPPKGCISWLGEFSKERADKGGKRFGFDSVQSFACLNNLLELSARDAVGVDYRFLKLPTGICSHKVGTKIVRCWSFNENGELEAVTERLDETAEFQTYRPDAVDPRHASRFKSLRAEWDKIQPLAVHMKKGPSCELTDECSKQFRAYIETERMLKEDAGLIPQQPKAER